MRKAVILTIYIILFWIILPVILVAPSFLLDDQLNLTRDPSFSGICLGSCILIVSVPLMITAIIQFRKQGKRMPVSATPAPVLIQKQLFAVWRHPIYNFYTLTFIGIGLILDSMSMLMVILPIFILLVYIYIRIEEKVLYNRFGNAYSNYRAKTPLVIPDLFHLLKIPFFLFFKCFFSFEIRNKSNIPVAPPFFIISSHRNYLDPFLISLAIPFPIHFIATYEVFRKPLSRYIFRKIKTIPRRRYLSDINTAREIIRRIEKDSVIGVFPEGERTWTGKMISLKSETIHLFRKFYQIPILPVRIEGNFFAWPRWGNGFRKAKIILTIQPPVHIDPDLDHNGSEAYLRSLIDPNDAVDPGLYCRSKRRTGDLTKILYRCPECHLFDGLRIIENHEFLCEKCNQRYELDPLYIIHYFKNNRKHSVGFDEMYRRIKVGPGDIRAIPGEKIPSLYENAVINPIITFSDYCILHKEEDKKLQVVLTGPVILTSRQLAFLTAGSPLVIDLDCLGSVTVESNRKLQLFDRVNEQLYQLTFPGESVKKWQDFLVETMRKELDFIPNTR